MKCAIMRTKILTLLQLLLPTLDPMPAFTQEEFDKAFEALPLPMPGPSPPGISFYAAIEETYIPRYRYTDTISDVAYDIVPYI